MINRGEWMPELKLTFSRGTTHDGYIEGVVKVELYT